MFFSAFFTNKSIGHGSLAERTFIVWDNFDFVKAGITNINPVLATTKAFFWEKEVEKKVRDCFKHRIEFNKCFFK